MMRLALGGLMGAVAGLAGAACILPAPWSALVVGLLVAAAYGIGEARARLPHEVRG